MINYDMINLTHGPKQPKDNSYIETTQCVHPEIIFATVMLQFALIMILSKMEKYCCSHLIALKKTQYFSIFDNISEYQHYHDTP